MIFVSWPSDSLIFFSADSLAAPDQIFPSWSAALVSSWYMLRNCSAFLTRSATCFAICSGWPVTICGRMVIGPPQDAVASIAVECGEVRIGPRRASRSGRAGDEGGELGGVRGAPDRRRGRRRPALVATAVAGGRVLVGRLVGVGAGLDEPVDLLQQLQERANGGDLAGVQGSVRGGDGAAEGRER